MLARRSGEALAVSYCVPSALIAPGDELAEWGVRAQYTTQLLAVIAAKIIRLG